MPTTTLKRIPDLPLRSVSDENTSTGYNAFCLVKQHHREVENALNLLLMDAARNALQMQNCNPTLPAAPAKVALSWDGIEFDKHTIKDASIRLIAQQFVTAAQEVFSERQINTAQTFNAGIIVSAAGTLTSVAFAVLEPEAKLGFISGLVITFIGVAVPQLFKMAQSQSQAKINRQYNPTRNTADPEAPGNSEIYVAAERNVADMMERLRDAVKSSQYAMN